VSVTRDMSRFKYKMLAFKVPSFIFLEVDRKGQLTRSDSLDGEGVAGMEG